MPTMTIPSANLRRLRKIAAEAAAKSSYSSGSHRPPSANLLRRRSPPPPVPRREKRVAVAGRRNDDASGGARVGARVLVRTPAAASAGTTGTAAPLVLPATLVRAVVVSAEDEHGYLEVVYEGAPPPGVTARVPRDRVIADAPPPGVAATSASASSGGSAGREASSPPPGAETENLKM
ncbi:unnamed protein product [Urochloa humidicola]